MLKQIFFDMDGTIADLYANPNWLPMLRSFDPTPYATARPLVNMSALARLIHKAQRMGYEVGIISWLSKESNPEYDQEVTEAKLRWLAEHLPSVQFDEIHIVAYGTCKANLANKWGEKVLFDDEERNRNEWRGTAVSADNMMEWLRRLV